MLIFQGVMLRIVSLPNDDSWDLFAIQGISGSVGGPAFRLYQHVPIWWMDKKISWGFEPVFFLC